MTWLLVMGLAIWVLVLQLRLNTIQQTLRGLERKFVPQPATPPASAPTAPVPAKVDTPTPDLVEAPAAVAPANIPLPAPAPHLIPPSVRPAPRPRPAPAVSTWLSENGLAWIGGGALALGGALLVTYAAQKGFFTPALRIWAALAVGLAMLAAGEWIRRQTRAPGARHALAAAMASAAGATTLYAAIWAAYALYHFIPLSLAGPGLALVSLGLLALAFLHGEPLALLAVLAAFLVPVVCRQPAWGDVSLDGYLGLIVATGLAATALRRWALAGSLTLAGAALWSLGRDFTGDTMGGAALLIGAPAMMLVAGKFQRSESAPDARPRLQSALPGIALIGASVLCLTGGQIAGGVPIAAVTLAALIVLAAGAVVFNLAHTRVFAAPALALVVTAASVWGFNLQHLSPWLAPVVAILIVISLALALANRERDEAAIIGAAGAAVALTFLRARLARDLPQADGAVLVVIALVLGAGAWLLARRSPKAAGDLAVAAWVAAGAEIAGLAIHALIGGWPEPLAYGLLGLALALGAWRLGWRGFSETAVAAALASFAALLGPALAGEVLSGRLGWETFALIGAGASAAQAAAWQVLKRQDASPLSAEAASTSALISLMVTLFLTLRSWATPHGAAGASLDPFTEASLRTLILLASGFVLTVRSSSTLVGRARGPVFLVLGILHGLLTGALVLNPWLTGTSVSGPPILDSLALAFLAPALLLAASAWKQARTRWATPTALAALLFAVIWAVMEIRRLFHGPTLDQGAFGYGETAAYGVAALGVAVGLSHLAQALTARRTAGGELAAPLASAGQAGPWVGLVPATYLLAYVASPWWGPLDGPLVAPILLFTLYGAGVALTVRLAWQARAAGFAALAHAGFAGAVIEVFALLTLAIRFAFHGAAMRTPLREASLETWTFSAAWALYGLAVLAAGVRGRDRGLRWLGLATLLGTTLKVFLFDMARLEGVVRAGSFLALGALLLIAALVARRLGGSAGPAS